MSTSQEEIQQRLYAEDPSRERDLFARAVILYQETYDRKVYAQAHPAGPKANYHWRLTALERAIAAGFRRVGIGSWSSAWG